MRTRSRVVAVLSLVVMVFGFSAQASAGAGQPPGVTASCQIARPSPTAVNGTAQVQMSPPDGNGFANFQVIMAVGFKSNQFNFVATIPGVQVVNGSTLDAICAMLVAPGTVTVNGVPSSSATLNDAIVQALGVGTTVDVTSNSVLGTACNSTNCQTGSSPRGLTFTFFPDGSANASGTVTLYLQ
jgi:hypothetical protein